MSFFQFAFNNVKRNSRAYVAYFLSSAFMVMVFFSFAVFINHPRIEQIPMGKLTSMIMQIAEYVIFLFAIFFVIYSISVFLKSRQREFGILLILGAKTSQLNRLIFLENMLIGAVSIFTGIAGGLLLSKLFLLFSAKMLGMRELTFYWPTSALLLTIISFVILFGCISLFTLLFIRKSKISEMLQGNQKPKKEPRQSTLLSWITIVLLAIGWVSLHSENLSPIRIFIAAATGIAGTYLFFSQLSVLMIDVLKRNRKFTWRSINLVWISEMGYKIKDNARILFLVTVMTSIACMSVSVVLAMDQSNKEDYMRNPFALKYYNLHHQYAEYDLNEINRQLNGAGVNYQQMKVETSSIHTNHHLFPSIEVISTSHFKKIQDPMNFSVKKVSDNDEAVLVHNTTKSVKVINKIVLDSGKPLSITEVVKSNSLIFLGFTNTSLLVVSDETYEQIRDEIGTNIIFLYFIPEWNGQLPEAGDRETIIGGNLNKWFEESLQEHQTSNFLSTRIKDYLGTKQGASLFGFIGIFFTFIFSVASASFLYFKMYTELASDKNMYHALSKVGLSAGEMRTSITLQFFLLFFIPILVSVLQTFVVLSPILKYMYVYDVNKPVLITAAVFLVIQSIYFFIVRSRYLYRLRKIMV